MLSNRANADSILADSSDDLITRIAWLYYKGKLTQQEIAESTYLSRQKVQRLLDRARDLEIIKFDVRHPHNNLLSVEERLRSAFGLRDAVVVPWRKEDVGMRRAFAMAGAGYLERLLGRSGECTLGLGWGNTTAYLADYFEPMTPKKPKVKVVSLIGNLMTDVAMNPYIVGMKIAEKMGAPFYNIWAPAITQSKERAESFRSEPWIGETLQMGSGADVVLLSIGEVSRSASLFRMGYLSEGDLARIVRKKAVGDILSRFFDSRGDLIDDAIHDRVVGIPLESLKSGKKTVVAVAGGAAKVAAIAGAIRGDLVDVLVTDERTARSLLKLEAKEAA